MSQFGSLPVPYFRLEVTVPLQPETILSAEAPNLKFHFPTLSDQMEALYSKLYDKYTKLKTKKLSELDKLNKDQEVKFVAYLSAAEELLTHLKNENGRLSTQVNDLRNELISNRSTMDEKCVEYQNLLIEANQKNKALSEEVERLQILQKEGIFCGSENNKIEDGQQDTPRSARALSRKVSNASTRRITRKRSRLSGLDAEEGMVMPFDRDEAMGRESAKDLTKGSVSRGPFVNDQLPECCRAIDKSGDEVNDSGPAVCLFQALIEPLVGMKLSAVSQTEGICVSVLHQSSGYSFSLTWINKEAGEEPELLYSVSSLGTFERVAPEWMREVLMFSTSMCPIFFERVSHVINLHN